MLARIALAITLAFALVSAAEAQSNRGTLNFSAVITNGGVFQQLRPQEPRWSITVQNNNTGTDACWLHIGTGTPTLANSILLAAPGGSFQRYFPYVPSDALQITCTTTGDTVYVDTQ